MRINKVVRKQGTDGGGASLNLVVAANVGEAGGETAAASTRQEVDVVQRDGRTVVRERRTEADDT